jgi:hypothetical protein
MTGGVASLTSSAARGGGGAGLVAGAGGGAVGDESAVVAGGGTVLEGVQARPRGMLIMTRVSRGRQEVMEDIRGRNAFDLSDRRRPMLVSRAGSYCLLDGTGYSAATTNAASVCDATATELSEPGLPGPDRHDALASRRAQKLNRAAPTTPMKRGAGKLAAIGPVDASRRRTV